jgi:D-proline reductase (dithiol) PrdB
MVRLNDLHEHQRNSLKNLPCPTFESQPWAEGPPLNERRVTIISTAGLHVRDDRPFTLMSSDYYRIIPGDVTADQLVMSHISTNFDRTGFQQDWNTIFPIDRLRELAQEGIIGSVADYHYSFMGANSPHQVEDMVRKLAGIIKQDKVDAIFLVPV